MSAGASSSQARRCSAAFSVERAGEWRTGLAKTMRWALARPSLGVVPAQAGTQCRSLHHVFAEDAGSPPSRGPTVRRRHLSGTLRSSSVCSSASTFCVGSCVEIIFIAAFVTSVAKSL